MNEVLTTKLADMGSNGAAKCCGRDATLRLQERVVVKKRIAFVRFECTACGAAGGLAINEVEALSHWP